jgi:TfoX/Sxy family transcriptional regulator of competence genes
MGSDARTAAHVLDCIGGAGAVSARRMFGEYAVYLDGKVVGLICDDRFFLKPTPGVLALIDPPPLEAPVPGIKPQIPADALLDDPAHLVRLVRAAATDLPAPKPKKPRKPRLTASG